MVKVVEGNLLDAKEDIIAHQVNCQGVMDSGVAKAIKQKWPGCYKAYRDTLKYIREQGLNPLGENHMHHCWSRDLEGVWHEDITICNMMAQDRYGTDKQYTDYNALKRCMTELAEFAHTHKKSVAMPYMVGCGRGGGNWRVVSAMIEECFEGVDVVLYRLVE